MSGGAGRGREIHNYEKAPAGVIVGAASGDRLPPSVVWESPAVLLPLSLLLRSLQTRLSVRQLLLRVGTGIVYFLIDQLYSFLLSICV